MEGWADVLDGRYTGTIKNVVCGKGSDGIARAIWTIQAHGAYRGEGRVVVRHVLSGEESLRALSDDLETMGVKGLETWQQFESRRRDIVGLKVEFDLIGTGTEAERTVHFLQRGSVLPGLRAESYQQRVNVAWDH